MNCASEGVMRITVCLASAILFLAGESPAQSYPGNFISFRVEGKSVTVTADSASVRFTFYKGDILRVDFLPGSASHPDTSFVVVRDTSENVTPGLSETFSVLRIASSAIGIDCQKNPLRLSYSIAGGNTVLSEPSGGGLVFAGVSRTAYFAASPDEHFYGTGERGTSLDRRGQAFDSYNTQTGGYGGPVSTMNVNIPFVVSTGGYAVYFDNTYPGHFDFAASDPANWSYRASGGELTYYLFTAASMKDRLVAYTWLTGRQPMPPRWALGYLQSKFGYRSEAEARSVVQTLRQKGIPADAIILDLYWYQNMGDFSWNLSLWNPGLMIGDFLKTGVKTILITEPYFVSYSPNYAVGDAQGVFGMNSLNQTYALGNWWSCGGCNAALLDMTNPAGRAWLWSLYRPLFGGGIAGVWTDLGEPERHPDDMVHSLGTTARVHNIYDLLWAETVYRGLASLDPGRRVFNLTRSGFAGIQRYGAFTWSGDVLSSFPALAVQVPMMLGMGMSGLAYHHSDTGGFDGTPSPELYIRWMQFSALSPVARAHGNNRATEPWGYGLQAEGIAKDFISLRYRLLPYLYTMAQENCSSGVPIARPLILEYPGDANLADEGSAYMLGDNLLVAPVTVQGASTRTVYLPPGYWYDFWTDKGYPGGQSYPFTVTLDRIPLFVSAGSILPMAPVMNYSDERPLDTLGLHLYPPLDSWKPFTLYEDDGSSNEYTLGRFATTAFSCSGTVGGGTATFRLILGTAQGSYAGKPPRRVYLTDVHCMPTPPAGVRLNGRSLNPSASYAELRASGDGYWFDPLTANLFVQAGTSADSPSVVEWSTPLSALPPRGGALPASYVLEQNFPNPFNPSTTIRYGLPQRSHVRLALFNTLGQQVRTLFTGDQEAGYHEVRFDGTGMVSGVYFYRIQAGSYLRTKRLLILR